MSRLEREILQAISDYHSDGDDSASASFRFPETFLGFQGHFVNNPILPGICKIKAALCVMDRLTRKPCRLIEVTSAKYFAPVTFGEEILLKCQSTGGTGEGLKVAVLVTKAETKVAQIQMLIENQSGGRGEQTT